MIDFVAILDELDKIEKYIADCDFETACKMLNGYNNDGDLFDFNWADSKNRIDLIITIHNHQGKPVLESDSFIEIYTPDNDDGYPVLSLSRDEIQEQVERLGTNEK